MHSSGSKRNETLHSDQMTPETVTGVTNTYSETKWQITLYISKFKGTDRFQLKGQMSFFISYTVKSVMSYMPRAASGDCC